MTSQELQEYNKLTKSEKRTYDNAKEDHPNWSHNQLMTKAKITKELDITIGDGKDPNNATILADVIKRAKIWLEQFTNIGNTILMALDRAVDALLSGAVKVVSSVFGWLFD